MDSETIEFIKEHETEDISQLALNARKYPEMDMSFVIQQITGRKIAKEKIPSWYRNDSIIYPKHLSLEQCSSELTAKYKASLCKGESFVDLTGGLGVDFSFMSRHYKQSTYVEKTQELVNLANHNFNILGLQNVQLINDDADNYLNTLSFSDTIYIDPARRNTAGQKIFLLEDCSPDIVHLKELIDKKSLQVIIKLSPMLDISLALKKLDIITEVHIISVGNECKELLLIKGTKTENIKYHCINIFSNRKSDIFIFTKEEELSSSPLFTTNIKKYLYEPNSSILKAGAYKSTAIRFSLEKLHLHSHLYTSDILIESFPGRKFEVKEIVSWSKKELKQKLKDISKANITVRNFPLSVNEIRKKTGIKEGGNIYIFATTLSDEKKVLILCEKI